MSDRTTLSRFVILSLLTFVQIVIEFEVSFFSLSLYLSLSLFELTSEKEKTGSDHSSLCPLRFSTDAEFPLLPSHFLLELQMISSSSR